MTATTHLLKTRNESLAQARERLKLMDELIHQMLGSTTVIREWPNSHGAAETFRKEAITLSDMAKQIYQTAKIIDNLTQRS